MRSRAVSDPGEAMGATEAGQSCVACFAATQGKAQPAAARWRRTAPSGPARNATKPGDSPARGGMVRRPRGGADEPSRPPGGYSRRHRAIGARLARHRPLLMGPCSWGRAHFLRPLPAVMDRARLCSHQRSAQPSPRRARGGVHDHGAQGRHTADQHRRHRPDRPRTPAGTTSRRSASPRVALGGAVCRRRQPRHQQPTDARTVGSLGCRPG